MSGPHPLLHPLSSAVLSAIRAAFSFVGSRVRKVRAVQVFPSSPPPLLTKQTAPSSARTSSSARCMVPSHLLLRTKSRSYLALKNNHSDNTSLSPADSVVNTFRQLSDSLSV